MRFTPLVTASLHITAGVALIDHEDGRMRVTTAATLIDDLPTAFRADELANALRP